MSKILRNRREAGLFGLLLGDAAGVPYEFKQPKEIPEGVPFDSLEPPRGYHRSHPGIKPGTWSDDGAQALAVTDSLDRHRGKYVHHDVVHNLIAWFESGKFSADGNVFDIGLQTRSALTSCQQFGKHRNWHLDPNSSNGNGSLMRTLPLGLYLKSENMHRLAATADTMSTITHGHIYSRAACALFVIATRLALHGFADKSFDLAERELAKYDQDFVRALRFKTPTKPTGSGFVLDTLAFARESVRQEWSFEETVRRAIALGGDTDTTASVAGGIVGVITGDADKFPPWNLYDPNRVASSLIFGI